ncbi:MAG: rhodanese-like domain-containing protein [Flavobacteriia bacterium]|nr:rhodanese-like domain-containing protein [Flavobacteriia bacterium]
MGIFSSLFGKKIDVQEWITEGALIVDVRSKGEYQGGHVKGSINIPLDQLKSNLKKLDKSKAIITCCASGMRSGSAKMILKSNGYEKVHNGGSWHSLRKYSK